MWVRTSLLSTCVLLAAATTAQAQQRHAAAVPRGLPEEAVELTEDGLVYTIQRGDTASEIAEAFEVSTEDLVLWNEGLDPDRIREGQQIRIDNGLRRVVHTIRRGDTLARIAARFEVPVNDIVRWNRHIRRHRIRVGRELTIFTSVPASRSRSIGTPQHGRLVDGRQLPDAHPGIVVRYPRRAWGTDETVRWILDAFDEVRARIPNTPELYVHDLSRRRGGELMGHHSHRSGRDADIAYYQNGCGEACRFRRIGPAQLDVERQWALFRHWLENDRVEAIFVDHALQRALYEHAREQGFGRGQLARWFQYPRPPGNRYGIIRHHPRHADHFHVRFVCHDSDEECR